MQLKGYTSIGGIHPETAAVKNILAFHGIRSPHDGKPFSEALLLGIGGGLGSGYILWEFEKHGFPSIVLSFQNNFNYPVKYLDTLCERIGATTKVTETTGKKKAAANLKNALTEDHPAITWLDLGGASYYFNYLQLGVAVLFGMDEAFVTMDNLASKPYRIPLELMTEARAKVPSFNNWLMTVHPDSVPDVGQAVVDGLRSHVEYLGGSSTSFALPAVRKWARMMTHEKNKKGWPTVFKDGRGLYGTLRMINEGIEHTGTGSGGLRGLYAEFLDEAAEILNVETFSAAAEDYRVLQNKWSGLAQAALPDSVPEFVRTKALVDQRAAIRLKHASEGLEQLAPINDELHAMKGALNVDFPMDDKETTSLFSELQERLFALYESEKAALKRIETVLAELD